MGHVSTGVVVARAASIAVLTVVAAALLRLPARLFEPLNILGVVLPIALVCAPVFAGVAIVLMLRWRARTRTVAGPEASGSPNAQATTGTVAAAAIPAPPPTSDTPLTSSTPLTSDTLGTSATPAIPAPPPTSDTPLTSSTPLTSDTLGTSATPTIPAPPPSSDTLDTSGAPTTFGDSLSYRYRVSRLSMAWLVIMVLAAAAVAGFTYWLAAALDVPGDGILLLTATIVSPLLIVGIAAAAVVEAVYDRWAARNTR